MSTWLVTVLSIGGGLLVTWSFFGIGIVRDRLKAAKDREQKMQSQLVEVVKSIGSLADVVEKSDWRNAESDRRIRDDIQDIKHSLERLLDGRR